jgi:hypothetical protein
MALSGVVLRRGMYNSPQVQEMQGELNATLAMIRGRECLVVDDGPFKSIAMDGDFGPNTEASIRRIQEYINEHNLATPALAVDGVFGPNTLRAMRALVAASPSASFDGAARVVQASYSPPTDSQPRATGDDLTIRVSDIVRPENMDATFERCRSQVPRLTRAGFDKALEASVTRINSLAPEMRAAAMFGIRDLYEDGYPVAVCREGGMRGSRAQERSRRSGFSQVGYGDSYHNYGFALDVVMATASGEPDDRFPIEQIRAIRTAMMAQGLHTISDATYRRGEFYDPMHFQYAPRNVGARAFARGATRENGLITDVADSRENYTADLATLRLLRERHPQVITPPAETLVSDARYVSGNAHNPVVQQLAAAFTPILRAMGLS